MLSHLPILCSSQLVHLLIPQLLLLKIVVSLHFLLSLTELLLAHERYLYVCIGRNRPRFSILYTLFHHFSTSRWGLISMVDKGIVGVRPHVILISAL